MPLARPQARPAPHNLNISFVTFCNLHECACQVQSQRGEGYPRISTSPSERTGASRSWSNAPKNCLCLLVRTILDLAMSSQAHHLQTISNPKPEHPPRCLLTSQSCDP